MKTLIYGLIGILMITACGKDGGDSSVPPEAPKAPVAAADASPTPVPPVHVQLTVYSRTVTLATSGASSVQGTGSCVVYNAVTYCWDDGAKSLNAVAFAYWGLSSPLIICPNFSGDCTSDIMTAPRLMSANVIATLDQNSGIPSIYRTVNQVLTLGNSVNTDCTEETDGTVDCGSFVIDTNQSPL